MEKTIVEKLTALINNSNMSISEISRKSKISRQAIYKIINNQVNSITSDTINTLCSTINQSPEVLYSNEQKRTGVKIPVLGTIPAGVPIEAIQEILDYEEISSDMAKKGEYFALKVKGDSMSPIITDGDVVIIKKQDNAESGKICVVMINGFDATLKEIKKEQTGIWILPKNPYCDFTPKFFTNDEIINTPVRIIGVAVEIRRSL
jgi:repressor LexA